MVIQDGTPGPKYDVSNVTRYGPVKPAGPVMGSRRAAPVPSHTPAPTYDLTNVTRRGPVKPAGPVMGFRHTVRVPYSPGPAAYAVTHVPANKPPAYYMGTKRTVLRNPCPSPAPNAYLLAPTLGNQAPDLSSSPMYSMPGRPAGGARRNGVTFGTPGPNRYPAVDVYLCKARAPRPLVMGRSEPKNHGNRTPASNAYFPGPGGSRYPKAPEVYMAGRLKRKTGPFLTAADRLPDWESQAPDCS